MQKLYLIKNLFFLSSCFILCYSMENDSYYQIICEVLTDSFQLHLQDDIDLSEYSEDIQEEINKINCQIWKNEKDSHKKRVCCFLMCLKQANQLFSVIEQKRQGNIITTRLAQSYNYKDITAIYKKMSAVKAISNNSSDRENELNSTIDSKYSSFYQLQG